MLTTATHPLPAAPSAARPSRVAAAARDALYLVSGLPIGIAAFTAAVTALALAGGLMVTLAGIPILVGTLVAGRAFGRLERERATLVLGPPAPSASAPRREGGLWERAKRAVVDPAGWRGALWAILSLPAGIVGFTVAVGAWSTALGLLTSGEVGAARRRGRGPLARAARRPGRRARAAARRRRPRAHPGRLPALPRPGPRPRAGGTRHLRLTGRRARQIGTPQSGNQRSSSGSIGSSVPACALSCSSRSTLRCCSPSAGTNGYQAPRLTL
jgi:hypothetical protein